MEIVLVLAAVVGISLIAVPRLRRRNRARMRPTRQAVGDDRRGAPQPARPDGAAPAGARGGPRGRHRPGTASAVATETYDEWDDDLDWGGETAVAAPPARRPRAAAGVRSRLAAAGRQWQRAAPAEDAMWDDAATPRNRAAARTTARRW